MWYLIVLIPDICTLTYFNFVYWAGLYVGRDTYTNSEDPDEMPHNMAFHQGLHCLFIYIHIYEKSFQIKDINYSWIPYMYPIDRPWAVASGLRVKAISLQGLIVLYICNYELCFLY